MGYFAVIDTETNWADQVMSIGTVIAERDTFKIVSVKYHVLPLECEVGGMYESVLFLDIPFSPQEAPAESSGVYVPDDADAVPEMRAGNATVTETPMGITIRFMQTVTSEDVWDNLKKVEFDGIVRGEGGWVLEDDGNWWLTVSRCTGEMGDTLTARYYDWDDQEIAAVVFRRQ